MTGTRIPPWIINRAIVHAGIHLADGEEACGFFFIDPGKIHVDPKLIDSWREKHPYVIYKDAKNMAPDPKTSSVVEAEWLAHQMIDLKLLPLAMFHSHPSGLAVPSEGDLYFFPRHYVSWSLLWTRTEPKSVWMYNAYGEVRHALSDGVVIPDGK